MLMDCIQHSLIKEPTLFWINSLALALLLLCMTVSWMMGIALFFLAMSYQPLLPSLAIAGLPSLPSQLTPDEKEAYTTEISYIAIWL